MLATLKRFWAPRPTIVDAGSLQEFLAAHAAFVAQKTVLGYCDVKTGLQRDKLYAEADFQAALTVCRWETFAAVLPVLAVLARRRLDSYADGRRAALNDRLHALCGAALAAQPCPPHRPEGWDDVAAACRAALETPEETPPRSPAELARGPARRMMDTLPVHENHRRREADAIIGAMQFQTLAAWDALIGRLDAAKTAADLLAGCEAAAPLRNPARQNLTSAPWRPDAGAGRSA